MRGANAVSVSSVNEVLTFVMLPFSYMCRIFNFNHKSECIWRTLNPRKVKSAVHELMTIGYRHRKVEVKDVNWNVSFRS